jgi:hypothetical protein
MKYQDAEKFDKAIGVMLSRIDEPLPKLPKPKWYDSVRKWELLLLAWKRGVVSERKQTIKVVELIHANVGGDCNNFCACPIILDYLRGEKEQWLMDLIEGGK